MLSDNIKVDFLTGISHLHCESRFFSNDAIVPQRYYEITTAPSGTLCIHDVGQSCGDSSVLEKAYTYNLSMMFDSRTDSYRVVYGGRFRSQLTDGDHVFQRVSKQGFAAGWSLVKFPPNEEEPGWWRMIEKPLFLQGGAEGNFAAWYKDNAIEPAWIRSGDTYYLYTEVQIKGPRTTDEGHVIAEGFSADRIQLHTSSDGFSWQRKQDFGVVRNTTTDPSPTKMSLTHPEIVKVPYDLDAERPYWLYVHREEPGAADRHQKFRIRSADPTYFDWGERELITSNFQDWGHQIGYFRIDSGKIVFLRICWLEAGGEQYPALQFSNDGMDWRYSRGKCLRLAPPNAPYRIPSHFGLATRDGTGELLAKNGIVSCIYGVTCQGASVHESSIGVGVLHLFINSTEGGHERMTLIDQFERTIGVENGDLICPINELTVHTIPIPHRTCLRAWWEPVDAIGGISQSWTTIYPTANSESEIKVSLKAVERTAFARIRITYEYILRDN